MIYSVFFAVTALIIILYILIFGAGRELFGGYHPPDISTVAGRCATRCVRNGEGEVMDHYDCCECKAIISKSVKARDSLPYDSIEPNLRLCMCEEGYGDYCYLPVTNFLLSQ
jgi:hypothetical protein